MQYRVRILETPDSTEYRVDTVVESKQSAKAVINRFLRKFPDVYEISVDVVTRDRVIRRLGSSSVK